MPSIRARQFVAERARARLLERLDREAAQTAAQIEYLRNFLPRDQAAAHLGISVHKLRRMMTAGTSPAYCKFGEARQATVRFPVCELDEYLADPPAYLATRADRMAMMARVVR